MKKVQELTAQMIETILAKSMDSTEKSVIRRRIENGQASTITDLSQPLAKSDYQIAKYGNGDLRLDFGPEVPESVKKKALEWAKRRNLKVKEASLGKSSDATSWILLGKA